jgi:hypothetical protein
MNTRPGWLVVVVSLLSLPSSSFGDDKKKASPLPDLEVKDDEKKSGLRFAYPKTWTNIIIADNSSAVEARDDDGSHKLTIQALAKPEHGLGAYFKTILTHGQSSSQEGWACIEGDREGGRRSVMCGKSMNKREDYLIVGITGSRDWVKMAGWKPLLVRIGKFSTGFKAFHKEDH